MAQLGLSEFGFKELDFKDVERKLAVVVERKQRLAESDFKGLISRKNFEEKWAELCEEQRVYTDFLGKLKLSKVF